MPSINATEILTNVNDEMMISPVNPSWAFNTQSSSFSTDARSEEEGRSSAMDPQEEFFYHYRRSFRDLSRVVRLRQAARQQQENEPRAITPFENPASSSHCLTNHENNMHTSPSIKYNHRLNLALSSYFLDFKVIYNDGGCFSPEYDISNVLKNDSSVYCSNRSGTVNLLLQYRGGRVSMDKSCVLNKVIIRSPHQGFTAPCKEGLVFLSHRPIDIKRTSRFDSFTKGDYDDFTNSDDFSDCQGADEDRPVAWFSTTNSSQHVIPLNERSGKYILIKLLRSEGEGQENIDLQYIGFVGYIGARSFASPPRLC